MEFYGLQSNFERLSKVAFHTYVRSELQFKCTVLLNGPSVGSKIQLAELFSGSNPSICVLWQQWKIFSCASCVRNLPTGSPAVGARKKVRLWGSWRNCEFSGPSALHILPLYSMYYRLAVNVHDRPWSAQNVGIQKCFYLPELCARTRTRKRNVRQKIQVLHNLELRSFVLPTVCGLYSDACESTRVQKLNNPAGWALVADTEKIFSLFAHHGLKI
jgi:hypothetical protein